MRWTIVTIILTVVAGCGPTPMTTVDDPAQESLEALKESLTEAVESVQAVITPPAKDEDGEVDDMPTPLPAALAAVVKAAQDLVNASSGKPIEPDAKAILSTAQGLVSKGKSPASAREIEQGLQQVRSKVVELRQKR